MYVQFGKATINSIFVYILLWNYNLVYNYVVSWFALDNGFALHNHKNYVAWANCQMCNGWSHISHTNLRSNCADLFENPATKLLLNRLLGHLGHFDKWQSDESEPKWRSEIHLAQ